MCTLKVGKDIHCPDLSNKRSQYLIPAHFPKAGLCNSKLKIWFCLYFLHDPFMTVDVYIDWMIYWLDDWLTECCSSFGIASNQCYSPKWFQISTAPFVLIFFHLPHMLSDSFSILTDFKKVNLLYLFSYKNLLLSMTFNTGYCIWIFIPSLCFFLFLKVLELVYW